MTKPIVIVLAIALASTLACGNKDEKTKKNSGPKATVTDAANTVTPSVVLSKDGKNLRKLAEAASACIKDEECLGPLDLCVGGCGVTYNPDKNPELSKLLREANKGLLCNKDCARNMKTACVKNKCAVVKQ